MGRHVPTEDETAAIDFLQLNGYKVVRAATYAGLQRRVEVAEHRLQWAEREAEHAREYSRHAWDQERRLADRLNQVCIAAASLGVSITQINDALAPRAVTDAMVEAALIEHRTSDLDGRALVQAMLAAALGA